MRRGGSKLSSKFLLLFPLLFFFAVFTPPTLHSVSLITNPRFTRIQSDSLSLTWDSAGGICYQVVLSTAPGFVVTVSSGLTQINLPTTSYFNLQPNTTYAFLVKASSESDTTYVSTSTYTLWKSPGFSGYQTFTTSVAVNISPNGTPAGTLYRVQASSDQFNSVISSEGIAATLSVMNLLYNTSYQISVQALNTINLPSTRTLVANLLTPATAPILSVFVSSNVQSSSVTVNWNPNGNSLAPPTSYQLQISTSQDFIGTIRSSVTFNTFAGDTTLSPNTSYYFRVRAYGRDGSISDFSAWIATFTVASTPTVNAIQINTSSVAVTLGVNGNPTGTSYQLDASTDGFVTVSASSAGISGTDGAPPVLTILGLQINATYQISAFATGFTNYSSSRTIVASTSTLARTPSNTIVSFCLSSAVILTWNANGNPLMPPTSYQAQISTDSSFGVFTDSVTYTTYASTGGLIPNTTYYFRVRAFNRMGSGTAFDVTRSTFTGFDSPKVVGYQIFSTSAAVMISSAGFPAGTTFTICASSGPPYMVFNSSSGILQVAVTTLTISGLTPNTSHFISARATVNGATSLGTMVASSFTLAALPNVTEFKVFATSIAVSFGYNGNPMGTALALTTGNYSLTDSTFGVVGTTPTAISTFVITGLNGNTIYTLKVGASDGGMNASTQTTFATISTVTLAAVPSGFVVINGDVGVSSISVSWLHQNSLVPPTSYQLQIATSSDFGGAASSETFVTRVTTTGLSINATYYFRVRAYGRGGDTTDYNTWIGTATLANSPAPTGFKVFGTSVSVNFTANGNPAGTIYRVQVTSDGFNTISASSQGPVFSLATADGSLRANATYQITVDALNMTNAPSTRTVVASTFTLPVTPGPFFPFAFGDFGSSSIAVHWSASSNTLTPPTSYQVQISTDINFGVFNDSKTFLLSATFFSLIPNTSYYFRTRAYGRGTDISDFNAKIATFSLPAPPGASFQVFTTSITVFLSSGGNPPGTTFLIEASTDNFYSIFYQLYGNRQGSSTTVSGSDGMVPTLTFPYLSANKLYSIRASATNQVNLDAKTMVASTYTYPAIPKDFQFIENCWKSHISARWDTNMNSLNLPTSYQFLFSTSPTFSVGVSTYVDFFPFNYTDFSYDTNVIIGYDISDLQLSTTYYAQVRAHGRGGAVTAYTSIISTVTGMNAPGVTGFQIFATSVTATLDRNGNAPGTNLQICAMRRIITTPANDPERSSSYVLENSSQGIAESGLTTLTIFSLTPNNDYRIFATAKTMTLSSGTLVASTTTLSLPPNVVGFRITSTTLSADLYAKTNSPKPNPEGTALMISSGSVGNFNVTNSSVGIVGAVSSTQTLTIFALNGNTIYDFQAGTRDKTAGAKAQFRIAALSTVTLAIIPGSFTIVPANIGNSSITAIWDNATNSLSPPTSYQLQISTWSEFIGTVTSSETFLISATTSSLLPNTRYFFRARAYGRGGDVTLYNSSAAVYTRPNAPTLISYQTFPTSVTVSFDSNNNPMNTIFRIYASTDGYNTFSGLNQGMCVSSLPVISLLTLPGNTTFAIAIDAINPDGLPSTRTAVVTMQTNATVPDTPTVVIPDVWSSSITVRWGPNGNSLSPPTSYQMQVSTSGDFSGATSSSETFNLFATTTTLSANFTYNFRVRAYGRNGNASDYTVTLTTNTRAVPPGFSGFQVFSTSVTTQLTNNGNPAGTIYRLQASTDSFNSITSSAGIVGGAGITLSIPGLQPNTTYVIGVDALNANNLPSGRTLIASTSTLAAVPGASVIASVSGSSITVSWTSNGNPLTPPTSYQVQVSTWNGFASTLTSTETFALQSSTAGLLLQTTYFFRVRAYGRGGDASDYNAVISTITGFNAPALVSFRVFFTSISVVLDPNGNIPGTIFSVSTGAFNVNDSSSGAADVNVTTLTLLNLTPNTTYTVNARAFKLSPSSSTFVASTTTLASPPILSGFKIFATSVAVTLGSNGNPDGTTLMISTGIAGDFGVAKASIAAVNGANTTLSIFGLFGNTTYTFQAGTRDSTAGASTQTIIVTIATTTLAAVPTSFSFASADVSLSSINLNWGNLNSLIPSTSYEMQISTSIDFTGTTTSSQTFLLQASTAGLNFNTSAYFRVRAFGRSGDTSDFSVIIVTVTRASSPGASGFQVFASSIAVSILSNGNSAATLYRLQSSTDGFNTIAFSSQGTANLLTVTGLQSNSTYQLGIDAFNLNNIVSSRTIITSTVTLAAVPGAISFPEVAASSFTVSWLPNGNQLTPPTSYEVQLSTSSDFVIVTKASDTFATQAIFNSLSPATSYYIRIEAFGRGGDTSAFNAFASTVTRAIELSVSEFQIFAASASVTVSAGANPAGTIISITTGSFEASASSSVVLGVPGSITIVVSNLTPNSLYTLRARASSNGSPGGTTPVTSTATLPAEPRPVSFSFVGQSSITFAWGNNGNPLSPPTSYWVQISSGDPSFVNYVSSITFALSLTTPAITPATTFYFRVASFGIWGATSSFSTALSTVTLPLTPPATPQAFTVVGIGVSSITFSWQDTNNETGYYIYNSSGQIIGGASQNTTSFVLTGLTPNFLVTAQLVAFNPAGSSSSPVVITSYTLANPPGSPSFVTATQTDVTVTWGVNSNPSNVIYELTQSLDKFATSLTVSTPVPFSSNFTGYTVSITSLATNQTYSYRVRAKNSDGVPTDYSAMVSLDVVQSNGSSISAGATTVTPDAGVIVISALLSDGTTQQIFVSTQTALIAYGNGISLTLPAAVQAKCVASANGLILTSTQTVPIATAGYGLEPGSGTVTVQVDAQTLSVVLATGNLQDLQASVPKSGTRNFETALNPPSGEIRTLMTPGTLSQDVKVHFSLPGSFPAGTAFGAAQMAPGWNQSAPEMAPFAAASTLVGTGVGLQIDLNKNIQPTKPVLIKIRYRDSDIAGKRTETLVLCRFEDSLGKWIPLSTALSAPSRTASTTTQHFSKFQLMSVLAASDVNQLKAYPNPLQLYQGDTEMTFSNLSENASVKIFTYTGELVRELNGGPTGIVRWDARNSSGETVASGVYIALIEGGLGSRKVIKIGVEK